MEQRLKILKAEWDLRPKTKFLRVEGFAMVESFEDELIAEIADPQGINPNILLINLRVNSSDGPIKPQPSTFFLQEMTIGDEPWTHVQVSYESESDIIPITKLVWAGNIEPEEITEQ